MMVAKAKRTGRRKRPPSPSAVRKKGIIRRTREHAEKRPATHPKKTQPKAPGTGSEVVRSINGGWTRRVAQHKFRDVTQRQRVEDQLREAQKMESIGRLAGGLAHDFNNILNIISAYGAILARGPDEKKRAEAADAIQKAVQRGAGVVRQLLTFAHRTGTGFRSTAISEVLRECGAMISEAFPPGITISVETAADLPRIEADADQIHQALLNLCVNARDAMPEGGRLRLTANRVPGGRVCERFPEADGSEYVQITVSDEGSGMDAETLKRIFEPFFTTKGPTKGSGLGLPVVYGIVRTHQGFIHVESKPGGGTDFLLYLPVSRSPRIE